MGIMKFGGRLIRNLFSEPVTEDYPAVPRRYPEGTRGHVVYDPSDCILCNICGRKCPASAIKADKKTRTVTIDRMSCVQCSACVDSCPKKCLAMAPEYTPPDTTRAVETYSVPSPEPAQDRD